MYIPKAIGEQLKEACDDLNDTIADLQQRLKDLNEAWRTGDIETLFEMGFIGRRQRNDWLTEIDNLHAEETGEAIQSNLEDD